MSLHKKTIYGLLFACNITYALVEPTKSYQYPGDGSNVMSVQLFRDGRFIAAFDNNEKSLSLYDTQENLVKHVMLPPVDPRQGNIGSALELNHKKDKIAVGQWRTHKIQLIDLETAAIVSTIAAKKNSAKKYRNITKLSWASNDNLLCIVPEISEKPVQVLDVRSNDLCFEHVDKNSMHTASIHPYGKEVFIGYMSTYAQPTRGLVKVFDMRANKLRQFSTAPDTCDATTIEFSPVCDMAVFANSHRVSTWNTAIFRELKYGYYTHGQSFHPNTAVTFNNDGSLLAIAGRDKIYIVDSELKLLKRLHLGQEYVNQMDWDGGILAAACHEGNVIKTWDLSDIQQ